MNQQFDNSPIFVRGLSRSGGTLLVTILDSHPEISMSYELYPTLYDANLNGKVFEIVCEKLICNKFKKDAISGQVPNFAKFIARAERGGIDNITLGTLMREFNVSHGGLDEQQNKFKFIELCCRYKMDKDGRKIWGLKCNNSYQDYLQVWPGARFINIIRDGRDVLASRMNTGAFNHSPEELGTSWSNTHLRFRKLMNQKPGQAIEIKYEELVTNPEVVLRDLTEKLGIQFDTALLSHSSLDLTLFKSHHLSMQQVKQPINDSKIGRWKKDVKPEMIDRFLSKAAEAMRTFGYEV